MTQCIVLSGKYENVREIDYVMKLDYEAKGEMCKFETIIFCQPTHKGL